MSQQPTAIIAGKMRLCGLATLGEKKGRLASVVFVPFAFALLTGVAGTLCVLEVLTWTLAARDCPVLTLAGAFLRLYVFGIPFTHFSGVDLACSESPGTVAFSWFASF